MKELVRLPDAELEVMKALWQINRPAARVEIEEALKGQRQWAAQTIVSMLARLETKGFVHTKRVGKGNLYSPAVKREDYLRTESTTLLEKLFDGSPKAFMAALMQNNALSSKDIEELENYLLEVRQQIGGEE